MTPPVVWPKKTFFYPIGDTPPVCLTQDLSPEKSGQILLLGCGDPRSILYTIHADLTPRQFPAFVADIALLNCAVDGRELDFTCCDWEPAILGQSSLYQA